MPADLKLLPRKEFILILDDGTQVPGQFGTWALKRFTDKKKISLAGVNEAFNNLTLGDATDFILCAIEAKEREAGQPLRFDDVKLCKWADGYAEDHNVMSGAEVLSIVITHASDESGIKKNNQETVEHGTILSDTPVVQE